MLSRGRGSIRLTMQRFLEKVLTFRQGNDIYDGSDRLDGCCPFRTWSFSRRRDVMLATENGSQESVGRATHFESGRVAFLGHFPLN
jgi:hypothetical protein